MKIETEEIMNYLANKSKKNHRNEIIVEAASAVSNRHKHTDNIRLTAMTLAILAIFPLPASALTWTGSVLDNNLNSAGNWLENLAPSANGTLSFAALASPALVAINNDLPLSQQLHQLIFTGGSYALSGGSLSLAPLLVGSNATGSIDPNVISVTGGTQTINSGITFNSLVLDRVVSQQVYNSFGINVSGGTLNLNGPITVAAVTPILPPSSLPYTGGSTTPPLSSINVNTATGSTLNLNGSVTTTGGLKINNNGAMTATNVLTVGSLSLSGTGQLRLQDNGALAITGTDNSINISNATALVIDNTTLAKNNRLGGAAVTLNPTASLELSGNTNVAVLEQAGSLTINGIFSSIYDDGYYRQVVDPATGLVSALTPDFNSPTAVIKVNATGQSTVLSFNNLAFGTDTHISLPGYSSGWGYTDYRSGGQVDFQTNGSFGNNERIIFTTGPASADGLINRATVNGNEFASYDSNLVGGYARGVVAATTRNSLAGGGLTDNVFLNGSTETLAAGVSVNSLASNNSTLLGSGNTITLGSGQILLNGVNSIAPALSFGSRQGEINVKSGQTDLAGGLIGSNGALVRGVGTLTISGVSALGGTLQVKSPTLVLAADNILPGSSIVMNGNTLSIGNTNQTLVDLSGAKISGTGSITATTGGIATFGDVGAQLTAANGTVNLHSNNYVNPWSYSNGIMSGSVSARDVVLTNMTDNSSIAATGSITANRSTLNGVISGAASLNMNGSSLTGASNHTGVTNIGYISNGYSSKISGNGALNNTSAVAISGALGLDYSTTGAGVANRINDTASLTMNNGYLGLNESAAVTATTVEKIGALNIIGSNNTLSLVGNVGVLADSLSVQSGGKLFVDMGASGSLKFLASPVAYNGAVVDGVLANRITTQGVLPVWATYDATVGLQSEHVIGALATAGTGIVRVTTLTNAAVTGPVSIGAAVFDTTDAVTGTGTLNTSKGLAFLQDNTLAIANVQMGSGSMLSNAGTNTISSHLTGSSVEKLGSGTIVLTGNSTFSNVITINNGKLVVDGTLNADVNNYGMGTGSLVIRGAGRVTGNMDAVTLESSNFTSTAGQFIRNVTLTTGSNFTNNGNVNGYINGSSGSAITNAGSMWSVTTNGANLTNATTGSIGHVINTDGVVTNAGTIGTAGSIANGNTPAGAWISNSASATLNNSGSVTADRVDNIGQISNSGIFVLLAGSSYADNGIGIYTQTAGKTTIDGTFVGDMLLQGGTLNGWGAIQGKVTVMNGASVMPGHSPGTMTIQDLTLENGSILNLDVSTKGGISDRLNIGGNFDAKQGSQLSLNLTDTIGVGTDFSSLNLTDYFSFSGASAANTSLFSNMTVLAQGTGKSLFSLTLNSNGSVASVAAVPEPDSYAMFLAGLGLLGLFTRRQRKLETV